MNRFFRQKVPASRLFLQEPNPLVIGREWNVPHTTLAV